MCFINCNRGFSVWTSDSKLSLLESFFQRCIKMHSGPPRILTLLHIKSTKINKRVILYAYQNSFLVNMYQKLKTNTKKSRSQNKFSIKLFEDFVKESLFYRKWSIKSGRSSNKLRLVLLCPKRPIRLIFAAF